LLLRSGRLLVAKQRAPVCFIEFGRAGPPGGLGPDSLLEPAEAFELADAPRSDFHVLAWWGLRDDDADHFPGVNELVRGDDGAAYVLSSKGGRIGRLERSVTPEERSVGIEREWKLPKELPGGKDGKPEGLALLAGLRPLISIDTRADDDCLVRLGALRD
jgi:hypothetical protein